MIARDVPLQIVGDASAPRALIVLQEAFGVNDHIRDVAGRFACAGYLTVAPELFHRDGSPEISYDDGPNAMSALRTLTKAGIDHDVLAAVNYLSQLGFAQESIGAVGFCMGGEVALYVDALGLIGAAVTFYGGGIEQGRFGLPCALELAPTLQAPWLGLYGDLDRGIPVEQVERLRQAVQSAPVYTEIVRYAEAQHGFHCDRRPAAYDPAAATDAANRSLHFLEQHLTDR